MTDPRASSEPPAGGPPASEGRAPPRRRRDRRLLVGATATFLIALVAALVVTNVRISQRPLESAGDVTRIAKQQATSAISQLQSQPPLATTVYSAAANGLVVVQSLHRGKQPSEDLGTGFVVDTQGDILTALHVVEGAAAIRVTFADGTTSAAAIKVADPADDIAVLAASRLSSDVVPEVLGGAPEIGDQVFVVGNPLGLLGSLSTGVISGLGRTFPLTHGRRLTGMIQFDAAVNPGSSGGPLLNTKGQVIGVVTGLANPAGADSFAGIAFAVPIGSAGQAAGAPAK